MAFQLLPSQLQTFNEQMMNALVRRAGDGDIGTFSSDCEQFLADLFRRIFGKFDMNALDSVLKQPKIFDWLVDRAVENRKLSFVKPVQIQVQTIEKIIERPVEIMKEVAPRRYPSSRITSHTDIAESAKRSIEALEKAEAERKLIERESELYRTLRDESLYATGGRGTHTDNAHARAEAKVRLDQFVARMNPATKKFLNLA